MATVSLVGSTGLVGANILATLKASNAVKEIYAFARKELPEDSKLTSIVNKESSAWPSSFPVGSQVLISGLGTTRGQAGGFENQRKIDYDLNLAMAKAAHANGAKAYVLVSSSGADSKSFFGYTKMKGELEDAVQAIEFEHVVILRPGLIVGQREAHDSRAVEFGLRKIASTFGAISGNKLKDFWAQDADVIAKAAVAAALDCVNGRQQEKVRILGQTDIVRLGRTEWQG